MTSHLAELDTKDVPADGDSGSRAPPVRAGTSSGGRRASDREYREWERAVSVPLPTRVITGRRGEGTKTFLKREVKVEPVYQETR